MSNQDERERYERGRARLAAIHGTTGEQIVDRLGDLGRAIVGFGYGDIYSRPGLGIRDRQLATVAMLVVLGRGAELRVHLRAALRAGLAIGEIEEVIIQSVLYAGFPVAMEAWELAHAVLREEEATP